MDVGIWYKEEVRSCLWWSISNGLRIGGGDGSALSFLGAIRNLDCFCVQVIVEGWQEMSTIMITLATPQFRPWFKEVAMFVSNCTWKCCVNVVESPRLKNYVQGCPKLGIVLTKREGDEGLSNKSKGKMTTKTDGPTQALVIGNDRHKAFISSTSKNKSSKRAHHNKKNNDGNQVMPRKPVHHLEPQREYQRTILRRCHLTKHHYQWRLVPSLARDNEIVLLELSGLGKP
ncbi:hypothetical protein V6N13_076573 [Hibiscus sabdariffa]